MVPLFFTKTSRILTVSPIKLEELYTNSFILFYNLLVHSFTVLSLQKIVFVKYSFENVVQQKTSAPIGAFEV